MSNTRTAYVIMPFSSTETCSTDEWTEIYENVFKPTIEACGYSCERARPETGSLIRSIIEKLQKSTIVLADITDKNANVLYELGVRHSISKRTIIVSQNAVHIPSDLSGYWSIIYGIRPAQLSEFRRDIRRIIEEIEKNPDKSDSPISDHLEQQKLQIDRPVIVNETMTVFNNLKDATNLMQTDCRKAETVVMLANRGLTFFGTDDSIISLANIRSFRRLRKLRVILLSPDSRWLSEGFIQLRSYESLDVFKKELQASHIIVESAMRRLCRTRLKSTKSGVRYYFDEPHFRMLLTNEVGYISSYAEDPIIQARDLPVYRVVKNEGSLYEAFKRYFNDLWHNNSKAGLYQQEYIDLETSAGGIVIAKENNAKYIALLRRSDGYWVLPKGHKMISDVELEATALREVSEETGIGIDNLCIERHLGHYSYDETVETPDNPRIVHLYLIRCMSDRLPELKAPDHDEAAWWSIDKSLPEMLYAYQRSYLCEVIAEETI